MTDKKQPTALDRLFNITVSDKEVKKMLIKQAAPMPAKHQNGRLSLRAARQQMAEDLAKWLHASGITGRGTKKLIDKVVSKALKGYETQLRLGLMADAAEAKRVDNSGYGKMKADAITARLAAGKIGNERYQPWRS
jgi:hypothetical protein